MGHLTTATLFAPGAGASAASMEQVVVLPRLGLIAVADAPGGGEDGRAGARLALELVRSHLELHEDVLQRFRRHPGPELRIEVLTALEDGFARAAQDLFAFARRRPGVLVTLDVLLLLDHEAFIGHVGDGRVYLVRRGLVHQLTVDHSRGAELPMEAVPPADGVDPVFELEPDTGGSTLALGPQPRVRVESLCMEVTAEDRFVVCTASLPRALPENLLHARFSSERLDRLREALLADAPGVALVAACAQLGEGEPFTQDSAQARLAQLAPAPLFAHCTERELRSLAQASRPRRLPAGGVVFEEGQPGHELYVVISGSVDVVKHGQVIANLGAGSNFGEMALLDDPVRSATAVAAEETELVAISKDAFFALLRSNPTVAVKVLWNLTLRLSANLRQTSARLAELERR